MLSTLGFGVSGIDISVSGIAIGRHNYPDLKLAIGNVYDDQAQVYGQFPRRVLAYCQRPMMAI
jgi:hypothetical protein